MGLGERVLRGLGVRKFGVQLGGHWLGGWVSRGGVQGTRAGGDKGEAQVRRNHHPLTGFELKRCLAGFGRERPGVDAWANQGDRAGVKVRGRQRSQGLAQGQ